MAGRKASGTTARYPRTEFLNVDLDLAGDSKLDQLAQALRPALMVVHQEPGRISLELTNQPKGVDAAIAELASVLTRLSPEAQEIWRACESREINIGIQAGSKPHRGTRDGLTTAPCRSRRPRIC